MNKAKLKSIFQSLQETKIYQQLTDKNLLFIGEQTAIDCLLDFLPSTTDNKHNYHHLYWSEIVNNLSLIEQSQFLTTEAFVIVSPQNEASISQTIKQYLQTKNIQISVLQLFADIFVNLMSHQTLLSTTEKINKTPKKAYAIVTTPRSGSTFLCRLLQSTQVAGYPAEHFREASLKLAQNCQFDYVRYLKQLMQHRLTANQVFGTKIMARFLREFEKLEFDFSEFIQIFQLIYLQRLDKLAQAVSILLAQKTQFWHINEEEKELRYQDTLANIEITQTDLASLEKIYLSLQKQDKYLQRLWQRYNIIPLKIIYEELEIQAKLHIEKILNFLQIDINSAKKVDAPSKKLSSTLSNQIIWQYEQKNYNKLDIAYVQNLKHLAKIYENGGQLAQASFYYERIIQIQPDNSFAYAKLAKISSNIGKIKAAIPLYRTALSLSPTQPIWFYLSFAKALQAENKLNEAVQVCHQAITQHSDKAIIYRLLAQLQTKQGKIEEAIQNYHKLIKLNPQKSSQVSQKIERLLAIKHK